MRLHIDYALVFTMMLFIIPGFILLWNSLGFSVSLGLFLLMLGFSVKRTQ